MKRFLRTLIPATLLATTMGLCACNNSTETGETTTPTVTPDLTTNAAVAITVSKPTIRATAPGQTVSGAFMTLINTSATPYALTAVSFSSAGMVEIHETSMNEGVMRMREVSHIDIPANGTAKLKPGSYHIMLMGLEKEMKAGATETLTLTFSDDSRKTVQFLVGDLSE